MKSRFLTLKPHGARIQVIEAGKGRDLLFLHGAGGHLPNDPLIAALAEKYHVLAPLLPGYGESAGEENLRDMLDITLHALDVLAALKLIRDSGAAGKRRIRVLIAGGSHPRFARNLGTGEPLISGRQLASATHTVHLGDGGTSRLVLPAGPRLP